MRLHVAVGVHGHEARVLQKARIDLAARARIARRHRMDDLVLEPGIGLGRGQAVHLRGRLSRVDGAAHHHHAARLAGIVGGGHQGNGGQHRDRGLADGHDVHVGAQVADEVLHVAHVVVQMERPGGQGHHAGVDPIRDVHVVGGQQGAHGVAQQGGVMARQRRDQQDLGIVLAGMADVAVEVHQAQNGLSIATPSVTLTDLPSILVVGRFQAGFWYSLPMRVINSYPAAIWREIGV